LRLPDAAHWTVIDDFLYKGSQARYPILLSNFVDNYFCMQMVVLPVVILYYKVCNLMVTRKYNRTLNAGFNIFDNIDSTLHAKHSDGVQVRRAFIYCAFPVGQATIFH